MWVWCKCIFSPQQSWGTTLLQAGRSSSGSSQGKGNSECQEGKKKPHEKGKGCARSTQRVSVSPGDVPLWAAPLGARTPSCPVQEVLVGIPGLGGI